MAAEPAQLVDLLVGQHEAGRQVHVVAAFLRVDHRVEAHIDGIKADVLHRRLGLRLRHAVDTLLRDFELAPVAPVARNVVQQRNRVGRKMIDRHTRRLQQLRHEARWHSGAIPVGTR